MTIFEGGKKLQAALLSLYEQREAVAITNLVMEKLTGLSRSQRLVVKEKIFVGEQEINLQSYIQQLQAHKPVQYVLNEAWFCGLPFYVDENVLIPRPETEELVEAVVSSGLQAATKNPSILDIGTGSGCIAISIKNKLKESYVYALDISNEALQIAKQNAYKNNMEIEFLKIDILDFMQYDKLPVFDIIVSNPPYIRLNEAAEMKQNVLDYEPATALFVPDDNPLLFYRAITGFAASHLKSPGGKLFFEINEQLGEEVAALMQSNGFNEVNIIKDLQHKNRIVCGQRN